MDKKLRAILTVQPLQEEVINCRNNGQLVRKITKQTCIAEIKKLQGIEVSIVGKELNTLKPEQWVKCQEIENARFDLNDILRDCEQTAQAVDFLK